jgi:hypothetical protein
MKKIMIIGLVLFNYLFLKGQCDTINGLYMYEKKFDYNLFSVRLHLYKNGCFSYKLKTSAFYRINLQGNWQLRDGKIVLDSSPYDEQMIVFPYAGKSNKKTINVCSSSNDKISYDLFLIKSTGDTVCFRNQFDKTKTKEDFVSFYIMYGRDILTSVYNVQSRECNRFDVYIGKKGFDNEQWEITEKGIIPLQDNGSKSNYVLRKQG